MKKPLLISLTALAVLGITTATTLYAQTTTGSSVIARMKAAATAFTLSADLNPGQTGLTSAPLTGKKTGDVLTAGEWNRVLELVASAGGGISDVELITSQAASPSATADYSFRVSQANCPAWKKVISGGCSYPNTLNTFVHNTPTPDLTGWICGGLHHDGDVTNNTTKYPYRPTAYAICGTYGGSGTGGSGARWVDVPLTDTNSFDKACQYRFTVNTNGDYASIAGTNPLFYAAAVDPFAITYTSHSGEISHILASSKNVYRVNGVVYYTVTKLEKLCGDGVTNSGGSGWVDVPLTDTADFDKTCEYRYSLALLSAPNTAWMSDTSAYYYPTGVSNKYLSALHWWTTLYGVRSTNKNQYWYKDVSGNFTHSPEVNVTKIEKRCN